MSLLDLLQAETERLGFLLWGSAPVEPPAHIATYQSWLEQGLHAGMAYLATERAIERRAQPWLILPEARSLLIVAMRYFSPAYDPPAAAGEALGRVASYAWGSDYHEIIPPRLAELLALIEKHLGRPVAGRSYTDTGPILERDFGQRAGLGWAGKNTCLISPKHGSYFLLGESLLDVEIPPSEPFRTDQCGTCTRCIEACPTTCIRPDRTIDSGRCISYLTIENKGPIAAELRPKMGDWVFGCDICQAVCPWNLRFATPEGHPALAPAPGVPRPILRAEIRLTPQEFNRKFKGSPILRAKRRGYLRNLAVALGNQPDPAAITDLEGIMEREPEPLVRAHSAWALGRMRSARARSALDKAARVETEPSVLQEVRAALDESSNNR
jgi:epoxyqueuosine reductase